MNICIFGYLFERETKLQCRNHFYGRVMRCKVRLSIGATIFTGQQLIDCTILLFRFSYLETTFSFALELIM